VYDFIISEIEAVEGTLPGLPEAFGRATEGAACALKCRAALYAGSIAQFGTVQKGGLVGIPQELANNYYQKAYEAAKKIQSLGKYELYNQDADKTQNFRNVFLKEQNKEMIFVKQFDAVQNSWWYGFLLAPKPHGYNAGMCSNPSLEMVEEFEYTDGKSGKLDREAIQKGLWTMDELFNNKDPRFYASIWTNGAYWKDGYVTSHHGLIDNNGKLLENEQEAYNGIPAWGNQNAWGNFGTGFGILKMLDDNSNANMDEKDGIDCPVFRYAEVLLNLAEAAYELGKTGEALDAINQIRSRAGIIHKTTIDRETIRHERKVELAFEGHRYWDVRRWRIAEDVLSKQTSGLRYILDYTASDFTNKDYNTARKFKIRVIQNYDARKPLFITEHYYLPITKARTEQNTNLEENPGYK
ncbi:MAG: RagB/SusD family nutrient uptake outer membrane protein, partial [Tannerellaceae bacterium]